MDSNIIDKEGEKLQHYKYKRIEIQCPDCGNIFVYNEEREIFCEICNQVFSESEVRARCGL